MNPPEVSEHGLGWRYKWPIEKLEITVDGLRERESGVYGEMTISTVLPIGNAPLTIQTLQLTSIKSRNDLATHLSTMATGIPKDQAKAFIEWACTSSVLRHRQGEPVLTMNGRTPFAHIPWRLNPIVYEKMPTVVFAPGGSGKSYFALFAGLLTAHGGPFPGTQQVSRLNAVQGACLYLDWEASSDAFQVRLSRVVTAHPQFGDVSIQYLSMRRPLADDLLTVQRHVKAYQTKLLIIDSLALASGGDINAPDSAIRFFSALRSVHCSSLIVAHVSKTETSNGRTIFGSVFFTNMARSVFEVQPHQDEGSPIIRLALHHTKVNEGPRQAPMALSFDFGHDNGSVRVEPIGMDDVPTAVVEPTNVDKIKVALRPGAMTIGELAQATGLSDATVRARCNEGRDKWCAKIDGKWTLLGVKK
jgi:hypothetical protein